MIGGRKALWLAAGALLPSLAAAQTATPDAPARPALAPPAKPMVLTRTLRRPLGDGREVISMRSYLLRFRGEGDRTRIDGTLLAVTVDAPPALRPLVEMERDRADDGMFPMWLDAAGILLAREPAAADPARRRAIDRTDSRLGVIGLPPAEEAQARAFVASMRAGRAGATPWPRDLFRPAAGEARDVRTLPLPDGGLAKVTVTTDATTQGGTLASFVRRTLTEIGGDRRMVVEEWTLTDVPE